ncbi:hypothetical protein ACFO5K_12465 [Nocardia halotolerans]|uniref:Minor tail protein n=1 Tax=Nocardia halotolerans TaxID=1755878 RepID=A0ABV8VHF0_9NOCA
MATQQIWTRAVPPSQPASAVTRPVSPVDQVTLPTPGFSHLEVDVPVIEPYSVASFGGAGSVAAVVDAARATGVARTAGEGRLFASKSWRSTVPLPGSGVGSPVAAVAIRSGGAVVAAPFAAVGGASGAVDLGTTGAGIAVGTAEVAFEVVAATSALFRGTGRYSGLAPESALGMAEGTATAEVAAVGPVVRPAAFAGSAVSGAGAGQRPPTSANGTLSVRVGNPAGATGAGAVSVDQEPRAAAAAAAAGAGTLEVAYHTAFSPSGMIKDGSWPGITTTWTTVPGWAADTVGFPGTTLSGDGLVVVTGSVGADISAAAVFTASSIFAVDVTLRLLVDGVVVATGSVQEVPGNGAATATVSTSLDLSTGAVVTVQAVSDQSFSAYNPSLDPGAGTYVRVTR